MAMERLMSCPGGDWTWVPFPAPGDTIHGSIISSVMIDPWAAVACPTHPDKGNRRKAARVGGNDRGGRGFARSGDKP